MRRYALPFILLFGSLDLAAAINGFVIDESGKPIPGARIRAIAQESSAAAATRLMSPAPEPPVVATAQSGDDGAFRLDPKRQPVVTLLIDAPGFGPYASEAADGMDVGAVALRAGTARKGRVTADGKPVANAWVVINNAFYTKTDERGEYTVSDPGRWAGSLLVLHPDYAPLQRSRGSRDATLALDATLDRGTNVTGRVVDGSGKPVANAIISDLRGPLATSGEDGSFVIAHLASDVKQLRAVAGSRIGTAKPGSATIVVRPAASLTGTVRSTKDDLPIAGAKVMLRGEPGGMFATFAITDAKGNFAFDAIQPGPNTLFVAHPLFFGQGDEVMLVEGTRTERALAATPAGRILGMVIDEQKKPVAAARVGFAGSGVGAFSAPDGSFTLRFPPMERAITLSVSKPSHATATHGPIQMAPGETKSGVRIVLPRGTKFEIRLIDAQGTPIVNEPVAITQRLEGERWRRVQLPCGPSSDPMACRSDAEGKIILNVAEDTYDVAAGGDTTVRKELRAQPFNASTTPMTIELERGAAIEGRVVWSDGSPMTAAASVAAQGMPDSGAPVVDGAFTLRNVPAGKVLLVVRVAPPFGSDTEPVEVTAPATGVTLKVPRPGRIEGRVVERETQRPVRQFSAGTEVRAGRRSPPKAFTTDDGRFTLEDVAPGTFDIVITAPGYVRASSAGVEVAEGKATSVEIALDRAATVVGRVTSGGRPLAGASVSTDDPGRSPMPARQSDANGDFTLDSVAPGARELRVRKDGYVERVVKLTATAGKEVRADVELSRGRELQGRVVDSSGRPIVGANVTQRPARADDRSFRWSPINTDAEGMFRLEGLSDEPLIVTATKDGFAPGSSEVNPATSTTVTITLGRGGSINGRIVGASRADLAAIEVYAMPRGGTMPMGMPNRVPVDPATGAFTITGVPDGDVIISAERQRPRHAVRSEVVVANGTAPFVELDFSVGFIVRGRVTRAGKPVRGMIHFSSTDARDRSRSGSGEILPDGTYEARVTAAGEYRVHVSVFDGVAGTVTPTATVMVRGDTTHDVDLRGGALRGRVVDAVTGAPMPNTRVTLIAKGASSGDRVTDSEGRFVFEFVAEGTHTLSASREGFSSDSRELVVAGNSIPEVELALARGELVEVRVIDAVTKRDLPAFVTIGTGGDRPQRGNEAVYRFWLRPGNYTLRAGANGYEMKNVPLVVPAPAPIVIELEVKRE